jgi:vesicle coat complex subunit
VNRWIAEVERFADKSEGFDACNRFTDGRVGAKANRGIALSDEKVDALIWGVSHENPVIRRVCLELLDIHPVERAIPSIIRCLDDPVPRVRWHAVHALICDTCKAGRNYLSEDILGLVEVMAVSDPSPKVRKQAQCGLDELSRGGA